WDTWCGRRGKNCYIYRSAADGLWRLIPWDLELTFGNVNAFSMPGSITSTYGNHFNEITRAINRPSIERMFYAILKQQTDNFFFTGGNSPLSRWGSSLSGSGVDLRNTLSFVNSRGNLIRSWIRGAVHPQVQLEIENNNGNDFNLEATFFTLEGRGPVDITSFVITRNGDELDPAPRIVYSNSNHYDWTARIPLLAGENEIEVFGFNFDGELVDTDSITVTNNPPFQKPVIASVSPTTVAIGETLTIVGSDFHDGIKVIFSGLVEVTDLDFDEDVDPTTIRCVIPEGVVGTVVSVEVENSDGQRSDPVIISIREAGEEFVRGDTNLDGNVDISDAVATLNYLFLGGSGECLDAMDTDDGGTVEITDGVIVLSFLFQGDDPPAAPYPNPGLDPTDSDGLTCESGL
ncbi:MAG: IPT/TIG domain-containing protein, partial [Planctomycetota bacterium]